jgi:creatinine amidohydrolase
MRPFVLQETNLKAVRENPPEVVVLPWGATEPHNFHLPYGTDALTVTCIAQKACQRAWQQGARVYTLPTVPFGVNTNMLAFPLVVNMNPSTQLAVVRDVAASVKAAGVTKLLLLNGHGGNDFNPIQRELFGCGVFIAVCNWWQVCDDIAPAIFDQVGDHADERETSAGLYLFPDLMAPLSQADAGKTRTTRFEAVNRGWVKITRPWEKLTTNSGVGDPHAATAVKGQRFVEEAVQRIGTFLAEFAKAQIDALFPYNE